MTHRPTIGLENLSIRRKKVKNTHGSGRRLKFNRIREKKMKRTGKKVRMAAWCSLRGANKVQGQDRKNGMKGGMGKLGLEKRGNFIDIMF